MICLSHQNWCGFFSLVTNMNSFRRTIIIQQCRDNCVAFFVAMKQRKEKRMNNTFMKKKPILPLLASMAMPMVLSMLVNSLYNIVDSFFVAKISEQAMTALSLVFPVQNFIMQLPLVSVWESMHRFLFNWEQKILKMRI